LLHARREANDLLSSQAARRACLPIRQGSRAAVETTLATLLVTSAETNSSSGFISSPEFIPCIDNGNALPDVPIQSALRSRLIHISQEISADEGLSLPRTVPSRGTIVAILIYTVRKLQRRFGHGT